MVLNATLIKHVSLLLTFHYNSMANENNYIIQNNYTQYFTCCSILIVIDDTIEESE